MKFTLSNEMDARGNGCNKKSTGVTERGSRIPLLSGDAKTNWALWQLSHILAEIANHGGARESPETQENDEKSNFDLSPR